MNTQNENQSRAATALQIAYPLARAFGHEWAWRLTLDEAQHLLTQCDGAPDFVVAVEAAFTAAIHAKDDKAWGIMTPKFLPDFTIYHESAGRRVQWSCNFQCSYVVVKRRYNDGRDGQPSRAWEYQQVAKLRFTNSKMIRAEIKLDCCARHLEHIEKIIRALHVLCDDFSIDDRHILTEFVFLAVQAALRNSAAEIDLKKFLGVTREDDPELTAEKIAHVARERCIEQLGAEAQVIAEFSQQMNQLINPPVPRAPRAPRNTGENIR